MDKNLNVQHLANVKEEGLRYITLPAFSEFPEIVAGFTTRFGGVSTGEFATLNLSFTRSDDKSNVFENYRLLSEDLGVPLNNMVLSYQTHSKNVMTVSKEHSGMGLVTDRTYTDTDGLITDETSLMLVTHYADCVPLYFYDPFKKVAGLTHSGWKGTLQDIAGETIKKCVMCTDVIRRISVLLLVRISGIAVLKWMLMLLESLQKLIMQKGIYSPETMENG